MMLALLVSAAMASPVPWRLAGVYDLATVTALDRANAEIPAAKTGWAWQPASGMLASCGPAKAPDGLGAFEAEALANGLSTALVVLLTRQGTDTSAPGPENLRVALGQGEPQILLQPAVEPRYLAVTIHGDAEARHRQLVRTQVEMELCMEHKVGRSWLGRDAASLRQAFLLDPPDGGRVDRKYFGGQREPVPALLGPPDACLVEDTVARLATAGRGEGSLDLVPSDVWGASLRTCGPDEQAGARVAGTDRRLPLSLADGDPPRATPRWSALDIQVGPAGPDADVRVDLSLDGKVLLKGAPLFPGSGRAAPSGLVDLLANVPRTYPVVGSADAVLIIPAWQVEEALARLDAGAPQTPRQRASVDPSAAVGAVLEHPELLFVQVRTEDAGKEQWLNLTEGMGKSGFDLRSWGFAVGLLASREPVVEAGPQGPSLWAGLLAQRALEQSAFLAGAGLVMLFGIAGLRRLPDLWSPVPRERADYWPGQGGETPAAGAEDPSSPDTSVVGEG